jgi:hypothetical protein
MLFLLQQLLVFDLKPLFGSFDGFVLVDAFLPGKDCQSRVHFWFLE